MSLAQFQDAITQAIFHPETDKAALEKIPYFVANDHAAKVLTVYRELALKGLTGVLRQVYPTVAAVFGVKSFARMCQMFCAKSAPRAIDPTLIAEPFGQYLEEIAQEHNLLHIADVATLDYGCYRAGLAIDAPTLNTRIFTDLSPEQLAARRIQLHPACFWMSSPFAIYDLWRYHHSPFSNKPDFLETPQEVVIIRPQIQVEVHKADIGLVKTLDALDAGDTLNAALFKGSQADGQFNPVAAIQFLVQNNLIVSLY
jgi:hypothetical protein